MGDSTGDNMGEVQASVTTDDSGWFKAVSPAFLELIGRPVDSLAGVSLIDLVHPLDAAAMRRLISDAGSGDAAIRSSARLFVAGDLWRQLQVTARDAGDGRVTVELATPAQASAAEPPIVVSTLPDPAPTTSGAHVAAAAEPIEPVDFVEPASAEEPATAEPFEADAEVSPFEPAVRAPEVAVIAGALAFLPPSSDTEPQTIAGPDVPAQRAAVRDSMPDAVPVVEIDTGGNITYATGPWNEVGASDTHGAAAFKELLEHTSHAPAVRELMARVMQTGNARQIRVTTGDGSRWIQLRPIPSPHRDALMHVLVGVVRDRSEGELIDTQVTQAVTPAAATAEPATERTTDAVPAASHDDSSAAQVDDAPTEAATAALHDTATPDSAPQGKTEKSGRGFFGWLLLAVAALLVVVIISKLWPSSDGSASTGPITVEIANADPVETSPGQLWRPVGVGSLGEAHGIATVADGAYVAGIDGTLIKLDASGAAQSALSTGGDETSFISDIAAGDDGVVWVLDAGAGQLYRVTNGDSVTKVAADANPLRNARGIGVSADGAAWIASTAGAGLAKVGSDGAMIELISLPGRQPSDVVDVGDGTLWIVDAEQLELVHLRVDGEVLNTLPLDGFTSPQSPHLAIDGGSLWVTHPELSVVFAVDVATGEAIGENIALTRPDDVRVNKPIGIAADANGRLWITDSAGGATIIVE